MKDNRYELKEQEMKNVSGGNTILPSEDSFWYSYNPSAVLGWGENWGDKGYFWD